jgi:hypothetical protein
MSDDRLTETPLPDEIEKAIDAFDDAASDPMARYGPNGEPPSPGSMGDYSAARAALESAILAAMEEARREGREEAAKVLGRIVFTDIAGLNLLKLSGPERDEWIVRATARKVLALVAAEIRAADSAAERQAFDNRIDEWRALSLPQTPGSDARRLPDGTLVTCEHCPTPHPKGDDGRPCLFPKVAPSPQTTAPTGPCQHALRRERQKCRHGFYFGTTCEACMRECAACWDDCATAETFSPRPAATQTPAPTGTDAAPTDDERCVCGHPLSAHRHPLAFMGGISVCKTFRVHCRERGCVCDHWRRRAPRLPAPAARPEGESRHE